MVNTLRQLFVAALAVVAGSMSAQNVVTFDASVDKGTRTTENPGEDMITKDGVTVTISNGCMGLDNHYRCYAGEYFTVSSTGDKIRRWRLHVPLRARKNMDQATLLLLQRESMNLRQMQMWVHGLAITPLSL